MLQNGTSGCALAALTGQRLAPATVAGQAGRANDRNYYYYYFLPSLSLSLLCARGSISAAHLDERDRRTLDADPVAAANPADRQPSCNTQGALAFQKQLSPLQTLFFPLLLRPFPLCRPSFDRCLACLHCFNKQPIASQSITFSVSPHLRRAHCSLVWRGAAGDYLPHDWPAIGAQFRAANLAGNGAKQTPETTHRDTRKHNGRTLSSTPLLRRAGCNQGTQTSAPKRAASAVAQRPFGPATSSLSPFRRLFLLTKLVGSFACPSASIFPSPKLINRGRSRSRSGRNDNNNWPRLTC